MAKKPGKMYLRNQDLYEQIKLSKENNNTPTVKFCEMIMQIVNGMLNSRRFFGYDTPTKENMTGNALIKAIKALKSFKLEYQDKAFTYFTRTVETSFYTTLSLHYRYVNTMRNMTRNVLAERDLLYGTHTLADFDRATWNDFAKNNK